MKTYIEQFMATSIGLDATTHYELRVGMLCRLDNLTEDIAVQMARQNAGLCCEECSSFQGHTVLCPLINRESAEIRSAERAQPKPEPQFSEADTLRLHGWGITL